MKVWIDMDGGGFFSWLWSRSLYRFVVGLGFGPINDEFGIDMWLDGFSTTACRGSPDSVRIDISPVRQ